MQSNNTTPPQQDRQWGTKLLVFNLVVLLLALVPLHTYSDLFSESVIENNIWSNRVNRLNTLNDLIIAIQEPSSHAFDTVSLTDDRERLDSIYQEAMTSAAIIRDDLKLYQDRHVAAKLVLDVDGIHEETTRLYNSGKSVIDHLKNNETSEARQLLLERDLYLNHALSMTSELRNTITNLQQERQHSDIAHIQWVSWSQLASMALLFSTLCFGSWVVYHHLKQAPLPSTSAFKLASQSETNKSSDENCHTKINVDDLQLNHRILVAEDGPNNQRFNKFVLKKAGGTVCIAENGKIAIEQAVAAEEKGEPFDIILMDMQMPEMDGYQATQQLREQKFTCPIIALTADTQDDVRERCLAVGCDDYLAKPVERKELLQIVAKHTQELTAV